MLPRPGEPQHAKMIKLSKKTTDKVNRLFSVHERKEVEDLLKLECGDNIPFCENSDKYQMERIRFAVLRISEGKMEQLVHAIEQTDWRDLLMTAGFGEDVEAHNKWEP